MSLLSFLLGEKKKTASVAKERLQIILAHERSGRNIGQPDYLPALQRDLIAVISKYIKIDPVDIKVDVQRQDNLEVLEVNGKISIRLIELLVGKIRAMSERLFEVSALAVRERIRRELLRLARDGTQFSNGVVIRPAPTIALTPLDLSSLICARASSSVA